MNNNKICCDAFKKLIPKFGWFVMDGEMHIMPYIRSTDLRVNYCPSCGKYIRDIMIPKKYFNEQQPKKN